MLQLSRAIATDEEAIRGLYSLAFGEDEAREVAELAAALLTPPSTPATMSLVAEADGSLVGHVAFSPVRFEGVNGRVGNQLLSGSILAPLAVSPSHQKQGIGTALVEHGLQELRAAETAVVLVYGDPAYYGRFGFRREPANVFVPPFELSQSEGWLALWRGHDTLPAAGQSFACVPPLMKPSLW